jgi:transglutaminase-like putative cysteine protease
MELGGMGLVRLYRTTEAYARLEPDTSKMPDLGLNSMIKLDKPINGVHNAKSAIYQITVKGDDDPATIFTRDARQRVVSQKGPTLELEVKALKQPEVKEQPGEVDPEFLKSSFFLDSDSPRVKALAAQIVGDETDPWKKAKQIEKWVHEKMSPDNGLGFVTASQIARDLKGDCRQHGMLTAALCRAANVPARTALGLVYAPHPQHGPVLGFHLWTEVWIKGQWLALDATLGQGGIGAGHLKIADHNWNDTESLAPLLPVIRAMGKIKIDSVRVE